MDDVSTPSHQEDVLSALTALSGLQQLTWRNVDCGGQALLSDSRLLQCLTHLTHLDLSYYISAHALKHLGALVKLQHLSR